MRATAIAALTLLLVTMGTRARAESPATLTVRVYNTSAIPTAQLATARRTAEPILRDAGLHVYFRLCGNHVPVDAPLDPCDEPLRSNEVVVRVLHAPAVTTTLHPEAYGVSYVVRDTDRGWLSTVFSDRTVEAATRVGADPGTLLGRVMAHEVGHLLLGTEYHGDTGVMRGEWPDALLVRKGEEWRFSPAESLRMQIALESTLHEPGDRVHAGTR